MKKKVIKIVSVIAAATIFAGICVLINAFSGNPISKHIATNTAEKHLEEKYGDSDFEIESIMYDFKDSYYHAFIESPSSVDSRFSLLIDMWGNLCSDNYEDSVLTGWNTASRIGNEYRNKVDTVFSGSLFPYNEHIGYGDIAFVPREYINDPSTPAYAIITEELTVDGVYDVNALGSKAGKLTVYIDDENLTHEHLAEIILDVRKSFDNAGIKFYALDLVLEYPKNEDGTRKDGRVEVREFLCADIYEEGLVERVKASDEAANAYYAEQDSEKQLDKQK